MTPSPEQQEHIKIAQRAALRNAQAFQMYTMMVAGGKRPKDALQEADDAMEVWSEYQDAHTIEPPPSPSIGEVLGTLSGMADRLGRSQDSEHLPHLVIEMANALEESVNVLESEGKKSKANKILIARMCDLVRRADSTAHPPAVKPSSQANGGLSQDISPQDISTEKENL